MNTSPALPPASGTMGQFAAALDWWRDAGVDCDYQDTPVDWLAAHAASIAPEPAPVVQRAAAQPEAPPPPVAMDQSHWPQTLAEFAPWWLAEPVLDTGGLAPRVPPRGPAHARLAVLIAQPELEDGETLLSGPQGRLLAAILAATGLAMDEVYCAALLPRHTPLADWDALAQAGFGQLARHHLALAAPRRVLVLGDRLPPLLGHDPAQSPATFAQIALGDAAIPAFAARGLDSLLLKAVWRANFWQRWLDWSHEV